NSSVPRSKSRRTAVATNATTVNTPTRLKAPSIRTTTYGALRLRLPIAPPMLKASVTVAMKLKTKKIAAIPQRSGWRAWYRSSKATICRNMRAVLGFLAERMEVEVLKVRWHRLEAALGPIGAQHVDDEPPGMPA